MTLVSAIVGILLILGFVNGLRRGLIREGIALIGILLGALLVEIWAPVWSRMLARHISLSLVTIQWLLALLVLLATALLAGYGGGLLLRPGILHTKERIAGALLGLLNLGLLLAFSLRYIQRWFFREAPGRSPVMSWIRQDALSRFLLDWTGVVLLSLALALAFAAVIAALVRLILLLRRPPVVTPAPMPAATQSTSSASQAPSPVVSSTGHAASATGSPDQPSATIPVGQQEKFIDYPPKDDQNEESEARS